MLDLEILSLLKTFTLLYVIYPLAVDILNFTQFNKNLLNSTSLFLNMSSQVLLLILLNITLYICVCDLLALYKSEL